MARIGDWRQRKAVPLCCGVGAAGVAGTAASLVAFGLGAPHGVGPDGEVGLGLSQGLTAGVAWAESHLPGLAAASPWAGIAQVLDQYGLTEAVILRSEVVLAIAGVAGFLVFAGLMPYQEKVRIGMRHLRGRILCEDATAVTAAKRLFAPEMRSRGNRRGLLLVPGVAMDGKRETEGFFVVGAPGSGKTQWFRFLLDQIIARSNDAFQRVQSAGPQEREAIFPDKIMAMDVKGDYTERWPDRNFMLMAPHDTGKRVIDGQEVWVGVAWDIAADVKGLPACRDFAAAVVEATDEPLWGDAARGIVAGILFGLQRKHARAKTGYGWRELRDVAAMNAAELRAFLLEWYEPAAKYLQVSEAGTPNRTTFSFLASIETGFYPLIEGLAAGWGAYPPERMLSLQTWFLDPAPACRSLILQKSMQLEELSNKWMRAVIGRAVKFVGSPAFPEDSRRRIWLAMDEFPQIAQKHDGFLKFAEVGRSKGFCPITGCQVQKQLQETWSEAEMETLEAMARTKLIFRTEAGAVAEYLAETWIGSSDWERTDRSRSVGKDTSHSISTRVERELVIMPSYFSERLGVTRRGVRFLLLAATDVCRLEVPFSPWITARAGTNPATWLEDPEFDFTGRGAGREGDAAATRASTGGRAPGGRDESED